MLKLLEFLCLAFVKQLRIKAGRRIRQQGRCGWGGSSSPPARTRHSSKSNQSCKSITHGASESINVEPEENVASHAPSDMASVSRGADGGVGPADHSFGVAPASVDPEPAAAAVPAPVVLLLQQSLHLTC